MAASLFPPFLFIHNNTLIADRSGLFNKEDCSQIVTNGEAAVGILGPTDFTGDTTAVVISPTKVQSDAIDMGFDPINQRLYMPQSHLGRVAVFEFVRITNDSLTNGSVGTSYNASITTSGAKGPKSFAVTSGVLPAGLSLNSATGAISGTPTSAVNGIFTVSVTDDNGAVHPHTRDYSFGEQPSQQRQFSEQAKTRQYPGYTAGHPNDEQTPSASSVIEATPEEPVFLGDEPGFWSVQGAAVEMEIGEQVSLCNNGSSSCSSSERVTATLSSINYDAQAATLTFSPSGQQETLQLQIEKNIDLTKDNRADLAAKLTHLEPHKALINFRLAANIKTEQSAENHQQGIGDQAHQNVCHGLGNGRYCSRCTPCNHCSFPQET